VTGWPVLAVTHLSPASDTSGFHLPVVAVLVVVAGAVPLPAAVGAAVGAAVAPPAAAVGVAAAAVVGALVGALVGARLGAGVGVGPPRSSTRPLRTALAAGAESRPSAIIRTHACKEHSSMLNARVLGAESQGG
jgi:hypothetical protein